ncbi:MAG: sigma-70 family RNA polymerase sigma factor [Planctomycetes bacterium]|nr:sigma-70 family RNA polymerase sigma factor [Planctomycetota bacterium]
MSRPDSENPDEGEPPGEAAGTDSVERAAARGDRAALVQLALRCGPQLRTYLRLHSDALLRDRESCSDLVQSVLGECVADLDGFEFRGMPAFRKWLFQKAQSKVIGRRRYWLAERRDPGREQALSGDQLRASFVTASQHAIRKEELAALEACFDELPEDYRKVLVATKLLGQSTADIAAELGRNEGAVRMLLHRAMAKLGLSMQNRLR